MQSSQNIVAPVVTEQSQPMTDMQAAPVTEPMEVKMIGKNLELPLPRVYNKLLKLFTQFESNMNLIKQRQGSWSLTLSQMVAMIEKSTGK